MTAKGSAAMGIGKHLILFVVTEDWYFVSHRLAMARAARTAGFRVVVATRISCHGDAIRREGFELVDIPTLRRALPIWREPVTVLRLIALMRSLRPSIVHLVALKPVLFGTIAARFAGAPPIVNTMTGLGFVFTSNSLKARTLRPIISTALRLLLGHETVHIVVQNREDQRLLLENGILRQERSSLILGSGVDCAHFRPLPEPAGAFTCAAVCRMLGDKGVFDLIAACRLLRDQGHPVRLLLAGPTDLLNPTAISDSELRGWEREGIAEWLGPVKDVRDVWRQAHAAVLPSHREGLPKALLEAAACGRPIVTTDTTGCREVVSDGINGLLVPLRSPSSLAEALSRLAADPAARRRMGEAGRLRAEEFFSEAVVSAQTVDLYRRLAALP